jgi:hypothetical protein
VDTPSTAFHRGFEYFRAHASEVTVPADAIVERLDVFGNLLRREFSALEYPLLDTLLFQTPEERLGDCIDAPMSNFACRVGQIGQDQWIQLADDVTFEAALDFFGGQAFGRSSCYVGPGARFTAHAHE